MSMLARRLGVGDAVMIGLGSMIGAGLFSAWAPASAAAGSSLLLALAAAALVAFCNASSSAQLAAQYPTSGGSYVYGRERLGEWPGFFAGWSFVIGKTASCAAMALTFAAYVAPAGWERPLGVVVVLALAAVNYVGVTRTALLARVLVAIILVLLVIIVAAALTAGMPRSGELAGEILGGSPLGVLRAAGLLFFAFAGYARVATMGEEVRDPARSIPRAISLSLGLVFVIYLGVGVALLGTLGAHTLAASSAPLLEAVRAGQWAWAAPLVRIAAAVATLGALLALIAGVGRTSLAMAREGDLPRPLAAVHPRYRVPHRAEVTLALVVSVLVLTVDLRAAIGFSSLGVLLYYLVANLSALSQDRAHRRYPRGIAVTGAIGCLVLVAALPPAAVFTGLGVLVVGVLYRLVAQRVTRRSSARL
ncbi:APC family permease [Galbitalea soli]|uniref:APC family permease n=1 Tax=Galbitalea soli TaxID=1268042 RepID=A0A7C9PLJ5_9MICO|nr:APC family permease [Galbitalea soli]NEM90088.1 APC family permease [Galbitalea soli]NYJ30795.1 APA family basic amino acid/polyamine antiporter [Galbitalea soli]